MDERPEKIVFESVETNTTEEFFVIEETKINEISYLLVADSDEDEAEALILKQRADEAGELIYDIVDDDTELEIISKVFEELLEDVDIDI